MGLNLVGARRCVRCTPPGKSVARSGGTDGIGRAVALELARAGDRVIFVGRNQAGQPVLSELRRIGQAPNTFSAR